MLKSQDRRILPAFISRGFSISSAAIPSANISMCIEVYPSAEVHDTNFHFEIWLSVEEK